MSVQEFSVSEAQRRQYHEEGFMILEGALSGAELALLRSHCAEGIADKERELRAAGKEEYGINLLGRRYFISGLRKTRRDLFKVIFSDTMAKICRAALGDEAYLHNEQFVVKLQSESSGFGWHQDSGYSVFEGGAARHVPYLTCWLALDDMSVENGTISVLPYSRAGTKDLIEHKWCDQANAMVGYHGDDPGDPVIVPAGSIVAFSSFTLHRSGNNRTNRPRRSYFIAYTPTLFTHKDPDKGVYSPAADPFLRNGVRVDAVRDKKESLA